MECATNMLLRRFISTTGMRANETKSFIPLISSHFTSRLLGKESFESSVDEDIILETLRSITTKPVPKAKYPFWAYKSFAAKLELPEPPTSATSEDLRKYLDSLTSYKYPPRLITKVRAAMLELVNSVPSILTKMDYLKICYVLHFFSRFRELFQVMDTMEENTAIRQDIDFENILISETLVPVMYKTLIERLDSMAEKKLTANTSTYYYAFNMLRNKEAKLQLIEMMQDFEMPIRPIFTMMKPLTSSFSPEQMAKMYNREGLSIAEANMSPKEFNTLVLCYLENDRAQEILDIMESTPACKKYITPILYCTFAEHFLKHNQAGYAFALSRYYYQKHKISTHFQLNTMLLNIFLRNPPYFENWLTLVRLTLGNLRKTNGKVDSKTLSYLNDYATLNKFDHTFNKRDEAVDNLSDLIYRGLKWNDCPIIDLKKNNDAFIRAARAVGHCEK